jgi:hypothetical protein
MEIQNEHRLTSVEDLAKSNKHRIDDLERRQNDLDSIVTTVQVLAVKEESIEKKVDEVNGKLEVIVGKSGARWDGFVEKVIWAIVAAVIGFLLAQIGVG